MSCWGFNREYRSETLVYGCKRATVISLLAVFWGKKGNNAISEASDFHVAWRGRGIYGLVHARLAVELVKLSV
jgi:hypothetical protein